MVTVVGSLNMDLVIETARLPSPGETVLGRNFRRSPGGKGANQALALARAGASCAMIGAVGADAFGEEMLANLRAAGVDVTCVARRTESSSGSAMIAVDAQGQNQIIVAQGANASLTPANLLEHVALIGRSRAVVAQLETPLETVAAALKLARQHGAISVLNPAPFVPGSETLLPFCDWLIPNEHEAACLCGIQVTSSSSARAAAQSLRVGHPSLKIALTLGANGVWIETETISELVPAFGVEAIDTVGAGDTFVGAFVTRLIEDAAPQEAARFGCAAAALAVTRRGAQAGIPTRAEIGDFLSGKT